MTTFMTFDRSWNWTGICGEVLKSMQPGSQNTHA
jgi:hypothetical protein